MAATNPSDASLQARRQPHMPKLLYRASSTGTTSSRGSRSTGPADVCSLNPSTAPTSPGPSDYSLSPTSARVPPDALSTNGPKSPSLLPPKTPLPKKRGGSFLRMFTAKEPSTQAFEDYQKQMMKKGASKNGRVAPVGMPGVSSAKLPPTVPKVNSKWDGVPQAVKDREKEKDKAMRESMSGYSRSIASSRSNGTQSTSSSTGASQGASDHRRNGKLSYNQSSGNLCDIYGWEDRSSSSGTVARDFVLENKTPPRSAKTEFTSFFPRYVSQPPNTPASVRKQTSADLAGPLEHYASPALTRSDSSPATPPPHPSPRTVLASPQSEQDLNNDIKRTTLELPSKIEEVTLKSSGVNILGPPASARRKPKFQPFPAGEADEMMLPAADVPIRPILKKDPKPRIVDKLPRSPLSTVALGSELETPKRPSSARGRLGLGFGIKNQAFAPRGSPEDATDGNGRVGTPTQNGQKLKRKSMMSLFSR